VPFQEQEASEGRGKMEKIIYILWRDPKVDKYAFADNLRNDIADKLIHAGVRGLQVNVIDEHCDNADRIYYRNTSPQMEAVLHVWVDCSFPRYRKPVDEIVAEGCDHYWAYLVTEGQSRRNVRPVPLGTRSPGLAQMGFGLLPKGCTREQYLEKMFEYTPIALSAQSLFYLQQNIVTAKLTPEGLDYVSMVEECFPDEAMWDINVFFDAPGDDEKMLRNQNRIMDGVKAFVEFDTIDVIPTSQYIIKPAF
jgi:hypothetical protein